MKQDVLAQTAIMRTPRVVQIESMFDVPPSKRSEMKWAVCLPLEERDWNIGLIVGPSGAGKSTIARALFADQLREEFTWTKIGAVIDDFPKDIGIKQIVGLLTSVGFGAPPAWLRPFSCLSTGEQFRVSVARALAESDDLVVIDEFTSTVDRQVAKISSSTVAKTVRKNKRQLIAVSCHYDIIDWLQPDWVYQPADLEFTWRSLQPRPGIEVGFCPIDTAAWRLFAHHHYLTRSLHKAAQCFGAFIGDECVGFVAYVHFPHAKVSDIKMSHRTVVLPDYQGIGLGLRMNEWMGEHVHDLGFRLRLTMAHPALVARAMSSPRWKLCRAPGRGRIKTSTTHASLRARSLDPRQLITYSFEYVPLKRRGKDAAA